MAAEVIGNIAAMESTIELATTRDVLSPADIHEAPDVLALFTALERVLGSPRGDTAVSTPVRPVPNLN